MFLIVKCEVNGPDLSFVNIDNNNMSIFPYSYFLKNHHHVDLQTTPIIKANIWPSMTQEMLRTRTPLTAPRVPAVFFVLRIFLPLEYTEKAKKNFIRHPVNI